MIWCISPGSPEKLAMFVSPLNLGLSGPRRSPDPGWANQLPFLPNMELGVRVQISAASFSAWEYSMASELRSHGEGKAMSVFHFVGQRDRDTKLSREWGWNRITEKCRDKEESQRLFSSWFYSSLRSLSILALGFWDIPLHPCNFPFLQSQSLTTKESLLNTCNNTYKTKKVNDSPYSFFIVVKYT